MKKYRIIDGDTGEIIATFNDIFMALEYMEFLIVICQYKDLSISEKEKK